MKFIGMQTWPSMGSRYVELLDGRSIDMHNDYLISSIMHKSDELEFAFRYHPYQEEDPIRIDPPLTFKLRFSGVELIKVVPKNFVPHDQEIEMEDFVFVEEESGRGRLRWTGLDVEVDVDPSIEFYASAVRYEE